MPSWAQREAAVGVVHPEIAICEALISAIAAEEGLRGVGWAATTGQVNDLIERRPDIIVVDSSLIAALHEVALRPAHAHPTIVLITGEGEGTAIAEAVRLGSRTLVGRTSSLKEVVQAVRRAARNESWVSPTLVSPLLRQIGLRPGGSPPSPVEKLSTREHEVLQLLVDGMKRGEIASQLHISPNTARTHIQSLQRKLRVRSAVAAVAVAREAGLRPRGARLSCLEG